MQSPSSVDDHGWSYMCVPSFLTVAIHRKPKVQNFQNLAQLDEYMKKLETASASFPHSQQSSEIKDL